jgi:hypothetical protein
VTTAQPIANSIGELLIGHAPDSAFPDGRHAPAGATKGRDIASVACYVLFKLARPKTGVRRWNSTRRAPLMTMPEAALHEHDGPVSGKYEIRFPWQCGDVQPESETCRMHCDAKPNLWFRVATANSRHHPGASSPVNNIRQFVVTASAPRPRPRWQTSTAS